MDRSEQIRHLWDQASADYDKHMADTGHYNAQRSLYSLLRNNFQSPILDLASGPGFLASLFLKDRHDVIINDFSQKMYETSKDILSEYRDARFSNQDAANFTFDNKFKTIVSCNLFYYLQDRDAAIKNWKKYLDTNGTIILFEEHPFQKPVTNEMESHTTELMSVIDPLAPLQIKELFQKHGLNLIEDQKVSIDTKHNLFGFVFKKAN